MSTRNVNEENMAEIMRMRQMTGIASLRNVMSLVTLIQRVIDRETYLPGMATFYGPSGFGKTTAATYAANVFDAVHIEVRSTWTKRTFCRVLIEEMGLPTGGIVDDMSQRIAKELKSTMRPLIIDECDNAVARGLIEVIRDIYEMSDAPVILIGEEHLPRKLERWERVHGRQLEWVAAEPAVIDDVHHLAPWYAGSIEIEDALAEQLLQESRHSIRRVCVNLSKVKEYARTAGLAGITKKQWMQSGQRFAAVKAPMPRGGL